MAQLIIRKIPDDIHTKFKMLAASQQTTMTTLVIEAIKQAVGKEGRRKK